jgi:hypothetical protein
MEQQIEAVLDLRNRDAHNFGIVRERVGEFISIFHRFVELHESVEFRQRIGTLSLTRSFVCTIREF